MNVLYYTLDTNEFNRIFIYIFAKKIWDRLEIIHDDTNQVRESKINILMCSYDCLKWNHMNLSSKYLVDLLILSFV